MDDTATITVTAENILSNAPVTISYTTSDGSAIAGKDYTMSTGVITFTTYSAFVPRPNWNETPIDRKTFTIPVLDDDVVEGRETVHLTLANLTGWATLDSPNIATLVIADMPDLTVDDFRLDPTAVRYSNGRYILPVDVTVRNVGGGDPASNVQVRFSDGQGWNAAETIPTLAPGSSKTLHQEWDITDALTAGKGAAQVKFTVTVDPYDTIAEVSNLNNSVSSSTEVDATPSIKGFEPEYFLGWFQERTSLKNQLQVDVDWNGDVQGDGKEMAGTVIFELNGSKTTVPAAGQTKVSHTYDMGYDLIPGDNHLFITPSNARGFVSTGTFHRRFWQARDPVWVDLPPGMTFEVVRISRPGPDLVEYRYKLKFPPSILKGAVPVPKNKAGPLGGKLGPTLPTWELWLRFRSDGKGLISGLAGVQSELKDIPFKSAKLGAEYTYAGRVQGTTQANQDGQIHLTQMLAGIRGTGKIKSPRWRVPQAPIISLQMVGGLEIEALLKILERTDTGKLAFDPDVILRFDPLVEGVALAGEKGLAYAEAALGTKPRAEFQLFQPPHVKNLLLRAYLRLAAGLLFYEKTTQWTWQYNIIGTSARDLAAREPFSEATSTAWQVAPRAYLSPAYATFVGDQVTATQDVNPIVTDAYPHADPAAAYLGNGQVLALWIHDDPAKPQHQAFELRASRWNGSAWSAPASLTSDQINDFQPALASTGNGALAVWTRFKDVITGTVPTEPSQIYDQMEIAYATYDAAADTWSAPQMLTDNARMDTLPGVAGRGGKAMVIWLQDPDNSFPLYPDETTALSEDLYYALWNGGAWTITPTLALSGIATGEQPQFAFDGSHALLVWSGDSDGNAGTVADREIYFSRWDTNTASWSTPQALTDDSYADRSPRVVYDSKGKAHLLWVKAVPRGSNPDTGDFLSQLTYAAFDGAAWSTPTLAVETNGVSDLILTNAWENGKDNLAAVWRGASDQLSDLYTSGYDFDDGSWSRPVQLTDSQDVESAFDAVYDAANDQVFLVLLQQKVTSQTVNVSFPASGASLSAAAPLTETIPISVPVLGTGNLAWTTHAPAPDLAIATEDIALGPINPTPGSSAVLSATVHNLGDLAASPVTVAFYDGDPDKGGSQIGSTQTLSTSLPGGITATLSVNWSVPSSPARHSLFVRVDPTGQVAESDETNNQAILAAVQPDLLVDYGYASYPTDSSHTITLTAQVINQGTYQAENVVVEFRQDVITGTLLGQQTLGTLAPGASRSVSVTWDVAAVERGSHTVYALVDPSNAISEADEGNNSALFWADMLPDLTLQGNDIQNGSPLSVTIRNTGPISATDVVVTVRDGSITGTLLYSTTLPTIPERGTGVFTLTLSPGTYTLFVQADAVDAIAELDESNNLAVRAVTMAAATTEQKLYLPRVRK